MSERRKSLRRRKLIAIALNNWHRCGSCFHVKERHEIDGRCDCGCSHYDPKARTQW